MQKLNLNSDCEEIKTCCTECKDEHCKECKDEHCKEVCKAGDLEEVCKECNVEEELNCIDCDLKSELGCEECTDCEDICTACDEVKTCEIR